MLNLVVSIVTTWLQTQNKAEYKANNFTRNKVRNHNVKYGEVEF
jgi:hypothetical protein